MGYYKLDPSLPLSKALHSTHFVEYPTIEVWQEFHGTIVDGNGTIIHYAEEERAPKRRRLNAKAGRKAIRELVGGYGSGEDEVDKDVLSMLGEYAESDEGAETPTDTEENTEVEDDDDLHVDSDPGGLLQPGDEGDGSEEEVDWGECSDDDAINLDVVGQVTLS